MAPFIFSLWSSRPDRRRFGFLNSEVVAASTSGELDSRSLKPKIHQSYTKQHSEGGQEPDESKAEVGKRCILWQRMQGSVPDGGRISMHDPVLQFIENRRKYAQTAVQLEALYAQTVMAFHDVASEKKTPNREAEGSFLQCRASTRRCASPRGPICDG